MQKNLIIFPLGILFNIEWRMNESFNVRRNTKCGLEYLDFFTEA